MVKRATREVLSKNKLVLLGEESFNLQTQFCLMEDVGFHVRKTLLCRSNVIAHVFSQVHQLPLLVDGIDLSNLSDTDTVAILLPHITSSSLISSEVYSHAHACLKGYIKGSTAGKHFIDTSISEDWYKLNRISRSISENSMCHVLKESALEDVIFVERAVQNLRARGYLGDIVIRAQPVGSHLLDSVILVRSRMVTLQLITSKVLSTLAAHVMDVQKLAMTFVNGDPVSKLSHGNLLGRLQANFLLQLMENGSSRKNRFLNSGSCALVSTAGYLKRFRAGASIDAAKKM